MQDPRCEDNSGYGHREPITRLADVVIQTQQSVHETSPIINVIPLQILAYRLAEKKGFNIDRPRNLAKSVTVT